MSLGVFRESIFVFYVYAQAAVETHPLVGQPGKDEKWNYEAAPIVEDEMETSDDKHDDGDPVAEAVFAGEKIKEFAWENILFILF